MKREREGGREREREITLAQIDKQQHWETNRQLDRYKNRTTDWQEKRIIVS